MLAAIISQYLETNRRLVIPQFGALLVKEPQRKVVFSPLLTRDDRVLCNLIIDSGMSEIEASGAIDRLVFDIRYALDANKSYLIEGVGRFVKDQTGAIQFIESPRKTEDTPEKTIVEDAPEIQTTTEEESVTEEVVDQQEINELLFEKKVSKEETITNDTTKESMTFSKSIFEPDPDLEGLSYGGKRGISNLSRILRQRGIDLWMVIAVAVVVIAICSILYGFLRNGAGSSISNSYTEQQF
ncbi:MAG: hypothetical protein SNI58_00375 [Rikenellaceae bacterium]